MTDHFASGGEWLCLKFYYGPVGKVFANGPGDRGSVPDRVIPKTQKMVLDASCSILSIIKYG